MSPELRGGAEDDVEQPRPQRRRDGPRPTRWWVTALTYVGALLVSVLLTYWAVGGHSPGMDR